MMVRLNILVGEVLAFSVLAFGSPSPGAEPRVYEIEIDKLAFGPAPEVLHMNDIVEWVNADIFQHTATAADGSFDVDLPAGAKGRTILKRVGVVDYFCRFHPDMQGRLRVAPDSKRG
jgi:plastocyanin